MTIWTNMARWRRHDASSKPQTADRRRKGVRPDARSRDAGPFGLADRAVFAYCDFQTWRKPMISAKSEVQVDTPEVRVTEWRLAPGSATGHHIHQMDYVIVPVTSGEMTILAPNGERSKAQLGLGKSYFRKAGVEHDVLNETVAEIVFLEVELKP
jgi:beta-alanine degradation protein BauB